MRNGKVLNNEVDFVTGLPKIETMYKLELIGQILPRTLTTLTNLMAKHIGRAGFLGRMTCEASSIGLNETPVATHEDSASTSQDHRLPALTSIGFIDGSFAWK